MKMSMFVPTGHIFPTAEEASFIHSVTPSLMIERWFSPEFDDESGRVGLIEHYTVRLQLTVVADFPSEEVSTWSKTKSGAMKLTSSVAVSALSDDSADGDDDSVGSDQQEEEEEEDTSKRKASSKVVKEGKTRGEVGKTFRIAKEYPSLTVSYESLADSPFLEAIAEEDPMKLQSRLVKIMGTTAFENLVETVTKAAKRFRSAAATLREQSQAVPSDNGPGVSDTVRDARVQEIMEGALTASPLVSTNDIERTRMTLAAQKDLIAARVARPRFMFQLPVSAISSPLIANVVNRAMAESQASDVRRTIMKEVQSLMNETIISLA